MTITELPRPAKTFPRETVMRAFVAPVLVKTP